MRFNRRLLPNIVSYFENQGLTLKGPRSAKWKTTTCTFHAGLDTMRVNVAKVPLAANRINRLAEAFE